MSAETLQAIEDAIAAHLADVTGEPHMVTDWFVAFARQFHDGEVRNTRGYLQSPNSTPQAVLGVAHIGTAALYDDITEAYE
ncbi:hypothetical protein [Gordonia sp. (in: high G+C Gram-positive bacteria)]|uniref:hypothetical protein n=1 Tax=Gordonia sp. (in: high G+C Gram-positive bacteria) TaxID=84139 RepID=UPI0039E66581